MIFFLCTAKVTQTMYISIANFYKRKQYLPTCPYFLQLQREKTKHKLVETTKQHSFHWKTLEKYSSKQIITHKHSIVQDKYIFYLLNETFHGARRLLGKTAHHASLKVAADHSTTHRRWILFQFTLRDVTLKTSQE